MKPRQQVQVQVQVRVRLQVLRQVRVRRQVLAPLLQVWGKRGRAEPWPWVFQ